MVLQRILIFVILIIKFVFSQKSLSSLPCVQPRRLGRVVGGRDSQLDEVPYIASLTRRGGHFCGASILNDKWLLTAGHCVCNGLNKLIKPVSVKGFIGIHKISEKENNGFQVNIISIVTHPEYKCGKSANDIALLKLEKSIFFSDLIKPICISSALNDETYEGTTADVSGWGWTNENQEIGVRSDVLQRASVEVWNNRKCENSFTAQNKPQPISKTQMCAGKETGGIDSCWADSGGPLISKENVLIGVVSTGVGCARPGLPGIYTRVSEYVGWIEKVVLN